MLCCVLVVPAQQQAKTGGDQRDRRGRQPARTRGLARSAEAEETSALNEYSPHTLLFTRRLGKTGMPERRPMAFVQCNTEPKPKHNNELVQRARRKTSFSAVAFSAQLKKLGSLELRIYVFSIKGTHHLILT